DGSKAGSSSRHHPAHLLPSDRAEPRRDRARLAPGAGGVRGEPLPWPLPDTGRGEGWEGAAGGEKAAAAGEGEGGDLPGYVRGAADAGYVRLQAEAGGAEHAAVPGGAAEGAAVCVYQR